MAPTSNAQIRKRNFAAFTIVELLVSMAVLMVLLVVMGSMLTMTTKTWSSTRGKIEQFRQARDAFESLTRRISQSTLNTYWDYVDLTGAARTPSNSGNFTATRYVRQSELRFISGPGLAGTATTTPPRPTHSIFFLAPLGIASDTGYTELQTLLNTWGYFIEYADDSNLRPPFLTPPPLSLPLRKRFRLVEYMLPSESMTIYSHTSGNSTYSTKEWFTDGLAVATPPVHVVAENVIALVLLPKLTPEEDPKGTALSPHYTYDSTVSSSNATINSKNQLPPVVMMTMIAIDENSAKRMSDTDNAALQTKLGTLFSDATQYSADLSSLPNGLEPYLISKKINYRIFTTNISIKGAKWSREQTN